MTTSTADPQPASPSQPSPTPTQDTTIIVDPASAKSGAFARSALSDGLKAWRGGALKDKTPPAPAAEAAPVVAQVDKPAAKGEDTGTASVPPPAVAPAAEASGSPKGKEPPAPEASVPPAGETPPPPASAAPPIATEEAPAAAPAVPAPKRTLPAEYEAPEWQTRFADDPSLRRTVARLEGDPSLTPTGRALKIAEHVRKSEDRVAAARQQQADQRELRRTNPQAFLDQLEADEAAQAVDLERARDVTHMIALALDVADDDPDFLAAGPQPGESYEQGLARFADYVADKSPLVQARLARVLAEHTTKATSEVEAVRQDYEGRIKTLEQEHKLALENALAAGRAEGRGATVAPPRQNGQLPGEISPQEPFIPNQLNVRSLIKAGLSTRLEAARDARLGN